MSKNKENNKAKDTKENIEGLGEEQVKNTDKEVDEVKEPTAEELLAQEKDRFLRLFAEFENYKKRTTKERIELYTTANRELMTVMLPVLDDFDRGLAEIKKGKDSELYKGMKLINEKFRSTLEQKGLVKIKVKKVILLMQSCIKPLLKYQLPRKN